MIKVNGKEIEFTKFPNGETNMNHMSFPIISFSYETVIDFKYEEDGDLIKLMFVKRYLDTVYSNHKNVDLRIWQMMYQRMDRSENSSPFTLKYVSEFINSLGFNRVEIVEPHSNVTPALINNSHSNYINFDLIYKVIEEIYFDREKDYIMFPDNGAANRYKNMKFKNVLIGHKDRDFVTGEIKKLDLVGDIFNAEGRKVLIVDDLSSNGGTFIHSSKALRAVGFEEVNLLVAHAENSIFKGELFVHIDKVFTTDSMLTQQNNWENVIFKERMKIYSLEDILNGN